MSKKLPMAVSVDLSKDLFDDGLGTEPRFTFNSPLLKEKKRTKKELFKIVLKHGEDWCCDDYVDTGSCLCIDTMILFFDGTANIGFKGS